MVRLQRIVRIVALLAIVVVRGATAQGATPGAPDPLGPALASYRDLDFDAAAARLRSQLALSGASRLDDDTRVRGYMYLGATELFRSRREAAVEAFRSLLLLDPRYRPDEVVFPPEVSAVFHEVRIGIRSVAVSLPPETVLRLDSERLAIRLHASALHQVLATIRAADGTIITTLHDGAIGDSLDVLWDARQDRTGRRAAGSYQLRVTSRAPDGRAERDVDVPLVLSWEAVDTLPLPPAPTLRPEATVPTGRARPLLRGLGMAAAAFLIPSLVGGADHASGMRFAVAGTLGLAGAVGFATASRPRPLADNIAWNREQQTRWEAEVARIRQENEGRLAITGLRIRAGRATSVEIR